MTGCEIRHSVTRFFGTLVIPAVCAAAVAYFGYYTIWGSRGLLVLTDTQARLSIAQGQLAALSDDRKRLEHRIALLQPGRVDPDLVDRNRAFPAAGQRPARSSFPAVKPLAGFARARRISIASARALCLPNARALATTAVARQEAIPENG